MSQESAELARIADELHQVAQLLELLTEAIRENTNAKDDGASGQRRGKRGKREPA